MGKHQADHVYVGIRCPHCSKVSNEEIGRLMAKPEMRCPHCRQRIKVRFESKGRIGKLDPLMVRLAEAVDEPGER